MSTFVDPVSNPDIPVEDVKAHIHFMKSINKLQESVHNSGRALPYIQNAVHRFHTWIEYMAASPSLDEEPIPPLDVLMIWHAYMLSPSAYYQDAEQMYPIMKNLGGMPWNKIGSSIDANTGLVVPTEDQIQRWERMTSLPFSANTVDHNVGEELPAPSFSTDLVAAVLRQSNSIKDMLAAVEHRDGAHDEWINSAVVRYGQFMRLPREQFVPPVDVDIIWHTHQLAGVKYWDETVMYFGVYIDHNDNITIQDAIDGQNLLNQFLHMLQPTDIERCGNGVGACSIPAKCKKQPPKCRKQ